MAAPARAIRPPVKSPLSGIPPGCAIPPGSSRSPGWWTPPGESDGRTGGGPGPGFRVGGALHLQPVLSPMIWPPVSRLKEQKPQAPGGPGGAPGEHPGPGIPDGRSPGGFCGPPGVRLYRPRVGPGAALGRDPGPQLSRRTAASITTRTGPLSRTWMPCPWSRRFTTGT